MANNVLDALLKASGNTTLGNSLSNQPKVTSSNNRNSTQVYNALANAAGVSSNLPPTSSMQMKPTRSAIIENSINNYNDFANSYGQYLNGLQTRKNNSVSNSVSDSVSNSISPVQQGRNLMIQNSMDEYSALENQQKELLVGQYSRKRGQEIEGRVNYTALNRQRAIDDVTAFEKDWNNYTDTEDGMVIKPEKQAEYNTLLANRSKADTDFNNAQAEQKEWRTSRYNYLVETALGNKDANVIQLLDDYNGWDDIYAMSPAERNQYVTNARENKLAWNRQQENRKNAAIEQLHTLGYTDEDIALLAEYRKTQTNAQDAGKEAAQTSEFNEQHPILGSAASVLMAPMKALGVGEVARSYLPSSMGGYVSNEKPIDINSGLFAPTRASSQIRQETSQKIDNKVLNFVYNAGMSALDSAVNSALGAGIAGGIGAQAATSAIVSGLMGAEVFSDTVYSEKQNGASDSEAVLTGIVRAAVESITEKYSLDEVLKQPKTVLQGLARSAIAEGSEEVASNWLNRLANIAMSYTDQNLEESIQAYVDKGYPPAVALLLSCLVEDAESALAGALSGVGMSAGAYVGGSYNGQKVPFFRENKANEQTAPAAQAGQAEQTAPAPVQPNQQAVTAQTAQTTEVPAQTAVPAQSNQQSAQSNQQAVQNAQNTVQNTQDTAQNSVQQAANNTSRTEQIRSELPAVLRTAFDAETVTKRMALDILNDPASVAYLRSNGSEIPNSSVQDANVRNAVKAAVEKLKSDAAKTDSVERGKLSLVALTANGVTEEAFENIKADADAMAYLTSLGMPENTPYKYASRFIEKQAEQLRNSGVETTQTAEQAKAEETPTVNQTANTAVQTESAPVSTAETAEAVTNANTENAAQTESASAETSDTIQRRVSEAVAMASDLGRNGAKAFERGYTAAVAENISPETAYREYKTVYTAALNGTKLDADELADINLPRGLKNAAQQAGEADRKLAISKSGAKTNVGVDRESARKAGVTYKQLQIYDAVAKAFGVEVKFADTINEGRDNGMYKDGVITVAMDAEDKLNTVVFHELTHRIRETAPNAYRQLVHFVASNADIIEQTVYNDKLRAAYEGASENEITEEMVAGAIGSAFADKDSVFFTKLAHQNSNVLVKIRDALKNMLASIKKALGGQKVDSRYFSNLENGIKTIDNILARAASEYGENAKESASAREEAKAELEKSAVESKDSDNDDIRYSRKIGTNSEQESEQKTDAEKVVTANKVKNAQISSEVTVDDTARWTSKDKNSGSNPKIGRELTKAEKLKAIVTGENKIKGLDDLIAKLSHDYGIPITPKHMTARNANGEYHPTEQSIRTVLKNNMPTISHELGHHIDHQYNLIEKASAEVIKELRDNANSRFIDMYPAEQQAGETFAEFLRNYFRNKDVARIDYPLTYKYISETMSKADMRKLDSFADEFNAFYVFSADNAGINIRSLEDGQEDYRSIFEKGKDAYLGFVEKFIDRNQGIKNLANITGNQRIYKLATNAAYADARAAQAISGALYDFDGNKVNNGLKSALKGLNFKNKQEYADFGEYLVVKHGPERLKEGLDVFANPVQNNSIWMQNRQAELERQYPQFSEISERLYAFEHDLLWTYGVGTGLISAGSALEWEKRWKNYVPFQRHMGDDKKGGRNGAKKSFANQKNPVKHATGSGREIINPVDNIIRNTVNFVTSGVYNRTMQEIAQVVESNKGLAFLMEHIPPQRIAQTITTDEIGEILKGKMPLGMEGVADQLTMALSQITDSFTKFKINGSVSGNIITVRNGGSYRFYQVNDEQLLNALVGITNPKQRTVIAEAIAKAHRLMTSTLTAVNPLFISANVVRDIQTAAFLVQGNKVKGIANLVTGIGSNFWNSTVGNVTNKHDALWEEYKAMGGNSASAFTSDVNLARKEIKKFAGDKLKYINPISWIEFVAETVESGPRYACYRMLRKNSINPQEAFYEAMDLTTNFRRGGNVAREINQYVPFFNAAVQGLDKAARYYTAEDVADRSKRGKVATGRMAGMIAASAILAALSIALNYHDDESKKDYERLSNYTKNNYYCIPLGDGKFIKLPKARELSMLTSLFERIGEATIGDNQHAFEDFYEYATNAALPGVVSEIAQGEPLSSINSLGIVGVFASLYANKNYLGSPIVPSSMENLENEDKYDRSSSKYAVALGKLLNIAPKQIDYFVDNVLGGYGTIVHSLFPVGEEYRDPTGGFAKRFIADSLTSTDITGRLYDNKTELTAKHKSHPNDLAVACDFFIATAYADYYSTYNKLSKNEPNTGTNRTLRAEVLDEIADYTNGYTTEEYEAVKAIYMAVGGDNILPSTISETYKVDGIEYTMNAQQFVDCQKFYSTEYWDRVTSALNAAGSDASDELKYEIVARCKREAATAAKQYAISLVKGSEYEKTENDAEYSVYKAALGITNDDGKLNNSDRLLALDSLDMSDSEKARIYSQDSKTWNYYSDVFTGGRKAGVDVNEMVDALDHYNSYKGDTKQDEYIAYLKSQKLSNEERYWLFWAAYPSSKKNPFGDYSKYTSWDGDVKAENKTESKTETKTNTTWGQGWN